MKLLSKLSLKLNMLPRRDDPTQPFKSDGCSGLQWLGRLIWFKEACRSHDYAHWAGYPTTQGDDQFLYDIAKLSHWLGGFRFIVAALIVSGMWWMRPLYRVYQFATRCLFKPPSTVNLKERHEESNQ